MRPINEGYLAFMNTPSDLSKLISSGIRERLASQGFEVVIPYGVLCKKTVIVWNIDPEIFKADIQLLINEITKCNPGLEITELSKFNNARNIKFVCKETHMADRCLSNGIRLLHMSYPPRMLSAQKPKPTAARQVKFCYRCYSINTHSAKNCDKSQDYIICSICSSKEHTWRNCNSTSKRCINCTGDHNTISSHCPKVKRANGEHNSRSDNKASSNVQHTSHPAQTYASTLRKSTSVSTRNDQCTQEESFKGFMSLLYASHHNKAVPGTFHQILSYLLNINKLPSFELGNVPALAPINPPYVPCIIQLTPYAAL